MSLVDHERASDASLSLGPETSPRALLLASLLQAGRLLRRWSRDPVVLIQSLIFPAFLLLVFHLVLDHTITALSGQDSIRGQLPLIALLGALFGTLTTGIAIGVERDSGLLARFWALPVARASGLTSRLLAEAGRTLISTCLLTVIGVALGFRFDHGVAGAIAMLAIPPLVIVGFATMVVAFGVQAGGKAVLEVFSAVCLLAMFFNSGFVPATEYPGWLQPVVNAQPMSPAINAMRGLAGDGPILVPVLQTLAWSGGLVIVFGWLAVRGYRRAAAE